MTSPTDAKPDLAAIEAAAKAATPGPWHVVDRQSVRTIYSDAGVQVVTQTRFSAIGRKGHNAAYLALLDPATVLWLLSRARDAERMEAEAVVRNCAVCDAYGQVFDLEDEEYMNCPHHPALPKVKP